MRWVEVNFLARARDFEELLFCIGAYIHSRLRGYVVDDELVVGNEIGREFAPFIGKGNRRRDFRDADSGRGKIEFSVHETLFVEDVSPSALRPGSARRFVQGT
jgi:hypothetical protein